MTGLRPTRRSLVGLGALAIGVVGAGAWWRRSMPLGEDISGRIEISTLTRASGFPCEGPVEAAVTMLVFSDYACGVCRRVEPWWRAAVDMAGDVRVIHRDWPILGPQSLRAAQIALAADRQRRYIPLHDALMRSPGLSEAAIRAAAREAAVDWNLLEADLVTYAAEIEGRLARTAQDALRLGFAGTPGFLIGPIRINGGASERQFADAIDRAREGDGAP